MADGKGGKRRKSGGRVQLTNCSTAIAIAIEVAVARIFQEALKYDYGIRKAYEGGTFFGGVWNIRGIAAIVELIFWPSSLESLAHSLLAQKFPRT